jgi:hypothetical protein
MGCSNLTYIKVSKGPSQSVDVGSVVFGGDCADRLFDDDVAAHPCNLISVWPTFLGETRRPPGLASLGPSYDHPMLRGNAHTKARAKRATGGLGGRPPRKESPDQLAG